MDPSRSGLITSELVTGVRKYMCSLLPGGRYVYKELNRGSLLDYCVLYFKANCTPKWKENGDLNTGQQASLSCLHGYLNVGDQTIYLQIFKDL